MLRRVDADDESCGCYFVNDDLAQSVLLGLRPADSASGTLGDVDTLPGFLVDIPLVDLTTRNGPHSRQVPAKYAAPDAMIVIIDGPAGPLSEVQRLSTAGGRLIVGGVDIILDNRFDAWVVVLPACVIDDDSLQPNNDAQRGLSPSNSARLAFSTSCASRRFRHAEVSRNISRRIEGHSEEVVPSSHRSPSVRHLQRWR